MQCNKYIDKTRNNAEIESKVAYSGLQCESEEYIITINRQIFLNLEKDTFTKSIVSYYFLILASKKLNSIIIARE